MEQAFTQPNPKIVFKQLAVAAFESSEVSARQDVGLQYSRFGTLGLIYAVGDRSEIHFLQE